MGGNNQSCLDLLLKYLEEEHMDKKKVSNYQYSQPSQAALSELEKLEKLSF